MWAEYGHFALSLAMAGAMLAASGLLYKDVEKAVSLARAAMTAQAIALVLAFICLVAAFLTSDFSVSIVAANSHTNKPLLYKIAGAWGNHEGSMLLWALLLSVYGALAAHKVRFEAAQMKILLGVLGLISLATLVFIIAASNPFLRLDPIPLNGRGLNPLLQDPALAIHPPILYAGYVGFAVPYAMAIASIWRGGADRQWAQDALPWILAPLAFLTLGVGLGSWWAYRELGWGGWWFWDPVENASLLPWLAGAALAHCAVILRKTGALARATLALGVISFGLSVLGTFLVRSGVLTSVHSFAVDPTRGVLIFIFMSIVLGGGLALFGVRTIKHGMPLSWGATSRPGLMTAGIVLLLTIAGTILLGTLYPLGVDALGGASLTVGGPYFDMTATPLAWALLVVMVIAPFAVWNKPFDVKKAFFANRAVVGALALMVGAFIAALAVFDSSFLEAVLFAFAVLLFALVIAYGARHTPRSLSGYGMLAAHGGVAFAAVGMAGAAFFSTETIVSVSPGARIEAVGRVFQFDGVERGEGANYFYDRAKVSLLPKGTGAPIILAPERRWYTAADVTTSEAVIQRSIISDRYITLGDLRTPGTDAPDWALRIYYRPFISWIWVGCLAIFAGAGLSAIGYVRAGRRKPVNEPAIAQTKAVAAE